MRAKMEEEDESVDGLETRAEGGRAKEKEGEREEEGREKADPLTHPISDASQRFLEPYIQTQVSE